MGRVGAGVRAGLWTGGLRPCGGVGTRAGAGGGAILTCVLGASRTSLGWGEVSLGCAQVQAGLQSIAVRVCEGGLGWGRGQFCPEWPDGLLGASREAGGAVG